jgi:hypothetical protein
MKGVESHKLVWTWLYIRQIQEKQTKTPPDTLLVQTQKVRTHSKSSLSQGVENFTSG